MAWTAPRTWVTGEVVSATMMNEQVRDNETFLRAYQGFRAYQAAAANHTSSGNMQQVPFDTELFDTEGMLDLATERATIPSALAGKWRIVGRIRFAANATGANRQLKAVKNPAGAPVDLVLDVSLNPSANAHHQRIDATELFAANDVVELQAQQSSGGSLAYTTGRSEHFFEMEYQGN